ncbi:MAG: hypothetical protein QOD60_2086, partial [Solirubrobacterales bacterium]|nr:hypothetical protein [Solirubrobacterales bacterium]
MAAKRKTKRTAHLKAVPAGGGAAAAAKPKQTDDGIPGLTPANGEESGEFVTDALVDLGYVSAERAERAVSEARNAGRPPEELLLEEGIIDSDQLSRAVAER